MAYLEKINIKTKETTSFHPDPKNLDSGVEGGLITDSVGSLKTRSAIFTDEGSFRYDFEGTTLTTNVTGTLNLSAISPIVTGVGTSFFTELQVGLHIKITTDTGTSWRQIQSIESNTELTLDRPYSSTTSGGSCHFAWVAINAGTGATITNANSFAIMGLGTTASVSSRISRKVDYPAVVGSGLISVSQRIANQDIYIGFSEQTTNVAKYFAWFRLNGTNNTQLILETCGIKSGTPVTADIDTQTITLPSGVNTSQNLLYRIEVKDQRVRFFVNDVQVGRDFIIHIPSSYDILGWGVVGVNGITPATNTTINIDFFNVNNANEIAVYNPSRAESFINEQPYLREFTFTQTGVIAINTDLLIIDCIQFKSLLIHCLSMGTGGIAVVQWTNDATLLVSGRSNGFIFNTLDVALSTITGTSLTKTNVLARYCVIRLTAAATALTTAFIVQGSQAAVATNLANQTVSGTVTANIGTGSIGNGTNLIGDFALQYRANAVGAASRFHLVNTASSNNASVIKASAGRIVAFCISNTTATFKFVKLHNQTTTPTVGVGVVQTIAVPPNNNVVFNLDGGIGFTTGIGLTLTSGGADNDTSVIVNASELIIDIFLA